MFQLNRFIGTLSNRGMINLVLFSAMKFRIVNIEFFRVGFWRRGEDSITFGGRHAIKMNWGLFKDVIRPYWVPQKYPAPKKPNDRFRTTGVAFILAVVTRDAIYDCITLHCGRWRLQMSAGYPKAYCFSGDKTHFAASTSASRPTCNETIMYSYLENVKVDRWRGKVHA